MELTVKQENLSKALNIIGKVASNQTSLPILNNILLQTNGSRLLIAANNLQVAISQNIGAKVEKVGSITVPAKLVSEFVSTLPRENIILKTNGSHLLIESENYKSKINGVAADDFPELPIVEDATARFSIPVDDFKTAVSQTIITASNDASRPILTGVYWHTFEGFLYLAATDGYRLSERKLFKVDGEIDAVIPTSSLKEVLSAISDGIEDIEVLFNEGQAEFHVGDMLIVCNLINGKFVDYRRLIPASTETNLVLDKADFVRTVKVAALFAREVGGSITLQANDEESKLSIHSIASELGENTSTAPANVSGNGEVTLNSRYLLEALNVIGNGEVEFGFSGKLAPTIIKSAQNTDYIHIIMPLKS